MIKLKIKSIDSKNVLFYIDQQSTFDEMIAGKSRTITFGNNLTGFVATNGVQLASCIFPEWMSNYKRLMVQGLDTRRNHEELQCTYKEYLQIYEAIKEYNELEKFP